MNEINKITRVDFHHFKAFNCFSLSLRHFNILVGPNNTGKSTIIAAFRILAAALRKACSRNPEIVCGLNGDTWGYIIDLSAISIAEENIFFNYDDSTAAYVKFTLSNKNSLILYFKEINYCSLVTEGDASPPKTTSSFKKYFNCPIGFVPILGPVEHNELLYKKDAAKSALFNYTAARNFRNIWHHYPEKFEEFKSILMETWPGMDIEQPKIEMSHDKPILHMFCPEERIPREIFWSGFGFQVWCQMLTHIVQSRENSLFLIDEPDIYLHSDLQRQLLGILRNLGPDIIIATHSIEIITEAEADDIVIVNKKIKNARRIKKTSEFIDVFTILGSNLNPILTQLAKTRRVIFVEGKDFQIIGKFARKLKLHHIGNRADFAVVSVEGFNPERVRNLKAGMEKAVGGFIASAIILDRDYRSDEECRKISLACERFCDLVFIHECKEIENYLLSPSAIDRAAKKRIDDQINRGGKVKTYKECAQDILNNYADSKKNNLMSKIVAAARQFSKTNTSSTDESTITEKVINEFEKRWNNINTRLCMICGKDALSDINKKLQSEYGINVTETSIIDAMKLDEIPINMDKMVKNISEFIKKPLNGDRDG